MMIKKEKLDFWVKNNYNVLFIGKHGVGKTAIIKETFERNNLNWKYFSASTLDPWVDLVGVPKEKVDENGNSYLDLIRPQELQNDSIDAMFFDELNRSHKKVRNAVMELLQFKSINGKKFNKLKFIWAAINPEDEDDENYDVEKLDPAQKDRFQIQVSLDYKPYKPYFVNKYGLQLTESVVSWWDDLPKEEKNKVSPRRLDYLSEIIVKSGDISDVIPESSNIKKLLASIKHGPIGSVLDNLFKNEDKVNAAKFLEDPNSMHYCIDYIKFNKDDEFKRFYIEFFSKETLADLIVNDTKFFNFVINNFETLPNTNVIIEVIKEIKTANQNKKMTGTVKKFILKINNFIKNKKINSMFYGPNNANVIGVKVETFYFNNKKYDKIDYNRLIGFLSTYVNNSYYFNTTLSRINTFNLLKINLVPEIEVNEVLLILDILSKIALNSQIKSINKKFVGFISVFNVCIKNLARVTKLDFEGVKNKFLLHNRHFNLYKKIINSVELSEKIEVF